MASIETRDSLKTCRRRDDHAAAPQHVSLKATD
jgi:hypothetical protein